MHYFPFSAPERVLFLFLFNKAVFFFNLPFDHWIFVHNAGHCRWTPCYNVRPKSDNLTKHDVHHSYCRSIQVDNKNNPLTLRFLLIFLTLRFDRHYLRISAKQTRVSCCFKMAVLNQIRRTIRPPSLWKNSFIARCALERNVFEIISRRVDTFGGGMDSVKSRGSGNSFMGSGKLFPLKDHMESFCLLILGWVKNFALFWHMLVCNAYITWTKQFKPWRVPVVISSIVVVGVLTRCVLLHSLCDLKPAQIKVQRYSAVKLTKNVCFVKCEGTVNQ